MNRQWVRVCAALLIACTMVFMAFAARAEVGFPTQASAMALMETESGCFLAEENGDVMLPMASTTKIMTALIVLENCDIDEIVEVSDEAVGVEGSSIYLASGEKMTVRDLLYGLMLASGNDAAVALAIHVKGNTEEFVRAMNERADALGLKHTHFITPNGLHADKHLTTAKELCIITREALKNETFREIVSTKYYTAESGCKARTFKNKNSLLWSYDGAFGVKTGYTSAAGRCLVFGAERDGMTVIGAILNCRPMFETAEKLLDHAFGNYVKETIVEQDSLILSAFAENGKEKVLEVLAKDSIITVMQRSSERVFSTEAVLDEPLSAPIQKGDTVGILRVYENGRLIGETELVAGNDVMKRDFLYWWEILKSIFA